MRRTVCRIQLSSAFRYGVVVADPQRSWRPRQVLAIALAASAAAATVSLLAVWHTVHVPESFLERLVRLDLNASTEDFSQTYECTGIRHLGVGLWPAVVFSLVAVAAIALAAWPAHRSVFWPALATLAATGVALGLTEYWEFLNLRHLFEHVGHDRPAVQVFLASRIAAGTFALLLVLLLSVEYRARRRARRTTT
ncbi:MAG TPA: hypothetical protein VF316_15980 [Polyangiaceae bacterium]